MLPPTTLLKWHKTYRLINSCYPPCDIWEDIISQSDDWQLAYEIEAMSNPRIRDEIGDISLIPADRRITGANAWWVISAFTHINPEGTRFADSTYGAYYAAQDFKTALKEKAQGLTTQFMQATSEPITDITCRTLVGTIDNTLHDIRDTTDWHSCYHKTDYTHSQQLARTLRNHYNSNGIVYNSTRHQGGECIAIFWPNVITIPIQERHVVFHWDGEKIASYFEIKGTDQQRRVL